MPARPTKGTEPLFTEFPKDLLAELRAFARGRGESVRHVLVTAVRRHMAYPPPPEPPPPVAPLPDSPPPKKTRRGGGGA